MTSLTATVCLALALVCIHSAGLASAAKPAKPAPIPPPTYLYVWAGATDPSKAKDSLFVVKVADGTIVNTVETSFNGLEPHHCRVSVDKRWLGCGGLLAVLSGLPSVHFFSLADPALPVYVPDVPQPQHGAIADEFLTTPEGGFATTMMGSETGGSPGRVVLYDKDLKLVGEYPEDVSGDKATGLNPHGIAIDWKRDTAVTVDYMEPASTLVGNTLAVRTTVRLWDTRTWTIKETVDVGKTGGAGILDVQQVGSTPGYFFTTHTGQMYYLDSRGPAPHVPVLVYNITEPGTSPLSEQIHSFRNGKRLFLGNYLESKVLLFDTSTPLRPRLLDTLQLAKGSGAHMVMLAPDGRTGVVATYFLDEGAAGQIHLAGDSTVHVFKIDGGAKRFLTKNRGAYTLDFKTLFPAKGAFRPHGVAFL
ncbi:hypothetical protein HYH03_014893 [Edaphochlamys debaryana]|uniref:Methanethiol oxidase n=1 Tax=Edaphochlamys debaryana TaxID=47281 RepID=A0A836BRI1_9CHLO|nr:hypothetical protein HYH03_014893 [Edaphochlamys debaryana]|eukprot:KAG2486446.1 hypothetical protein HYH03_014893 [Edaphochlamys debaryana]